MTGSRPAAGAPASEPQGFAERIVSRVAATGPLCAGIDPSRAVLEAWELPDGPAGLRACGKRLLEALADVVPVVKVQVAFFERHGVAGFEVLRELLDDARSAGMLVIADAKRGDIADTSAAYADAWLAPESPLASDALTAVAYLGLGSLEPMIVSAERSGRAVIVVALGSNPEARSVDQARTSSGATVGDMLLAEIAARNQRSRHQRSRGGRAGSSSEDAGAWLGPVGAVVAATRDPSEFALESLGGVLLAPGIGAQGADPAQVARRFGRCTPGTVLPHVSRSLLSAGPDPTSLRRRARALRDELASRLL